MTQRVEEETLAEVRCYHCGGMVGGGGEEEEGKQFCCPGCRAVYHILSENNLCTYYALDAAPGVTPESAAGHRFEYLDSPEVARRLLDFTDGRSSVITFRLPGMHCSSCVWLLEQLHRLDGGVIHSRVDFLKKSLAVRYREGATSLRKVVELLASLGYEPDLRLDALDRHERTVKPDRSLYYRIGVAGFCFSNIMLFSFPEYLSGSTLDPDMRRMFGFMNLLLATPVLFYSGWGYFRSAAAGLRNRTLNLDVPIALGLAILFLRSVAEILTGTGAGYLDSMTGLVFLLLVGRIFQNKTYDALDFHRTYTAYFPLAVSVQKEGREVATPVVDLHSGDRLVLRHGEIVPADSVALRSTHLDYSFVTGESRPVAVHHGERIYAGARIAGSAAEAEIVKSVSESYLTHLWSESRGERLQRQGLSEFADEVSAYFTTAILLIAAGVAAFWVPRDPGRALDAVTAVLIVACPCALALATPFAFGTAMRILGKNGLYLRGARVVEDLARATRIVFDKTGTISHAGTSRVNFVGNELSLEERRMVAALTRNSLHPLSRAILDTLPRPTAALEVAEYHEISGEGIEGMVAGVPIRLGTVAFTLSNGTAGVKPPRPGESRVYLSLAGVSRGFFALENFYREGLSDLLCRLRRRYLLSVVSGDNDGERGRLLGMFGEPVELRFAQLPADKMEYLRALRREGARVIMVGDGLNDAGALMESSVGIAVAENPGAFSPASDAILDGGAFRRLDAFLAFCRDATRTVAVGFLISFAYNAAGLWFAVRGELSPLLAAVLMPVSSVTVVLVAALGVRRAARSREFL